MHLNVPGFNIFFNYNGAKIYFTRNLNCIKILESKNIGRKTFSIKFVSLCATNISLFLYIYKSYLNLRYKFIKNIFINLHVESLNLFLQK